MSTEGKTMEIIEPLRFAVGSHQRGSGKGCVMNVVSYMNGDRVITDLPPCSDPMLAKIMHRVNDEICSHRDGDLLCPECSLIVEDLGTATMGTGDTGLSDLDLRRVYVRCAVRAARRVPQNDESEAALAAALAWADDPSEENRDAAYAAIYAATYAATYAVCAADADDAAAYAAAAYAASAAYAAYAAYDDKRALVETARDIIAYFKELTGTGKTISEERVAAAYREMVDAQ